MSGKSHTFWFEWGPAGEPVVVGVRSLHAAQKPLPYKACASSYWWGSRQICWMLALFARFAATLLRQGALIGGPGDTRAKKSSAWPPVSLLTQSQFCPYETETKSWRCLPLEPWRSLLEPTDVNLNANRTCACKSTRRLEPLLRQVVRWKQWGKLRGSEKKAFWSPILKGMHMHRTWRQTSFWVFLCCLLLCCLFHIYLE